METEIFHSETTNIEPPKSASESWFQKAKEHQGNFFELLKNCELKDLVGLFEKKGGGLKDIKLLSEEKIKELKSQGRPRFVNTNLYLMKKEDVLAAVKKEIEDRLNIN